MSGWTEERVERLKRLVKEGLSNTQIAKQLGGSATRNSVGGKIDRLGLRGAVERPTAKSAAVYVPRAPKPASDFGRAPVEDNRKTRLHPAGNRVYLVAEDRPLPPERDTAPGSATQATLGAHMCKWPIGDPQDAGFTYCGARAVGKRPYCPTHLGAAHVVPKKNTPRTANELARSLRRYL